MPTYNKQEKSFLAKKIGETRVNGTNGNTEYWSGDNYGWQSQNGHTEALAKEKARTNGAIDKPLWDAVDDGTEAIGTFVASLPGVKEVGGAIHYVGEKLEETAANDAANGNGNSLANIVVNGASGWRQSVEWFGNGARTNYRAAEFLIEGVTGLELDDRGRDRYAGALQFAGEEIATFGAGKLASKAKDLIPPAPKPVMVAMSPDGTLQLTNLPDKRVRGGDVFELTASEKYRVPGRSRQGMVDDYPETIESIEKAEKRNTPGYKPGERSFNEYISFSPEFKDKPLDPVAYHKFIRKHNFVKNFQRLDIEQPAGKTFRKMEQHHLFPVGESGPFIERMRTLAKKGVGDNDDVVNMFAYADYLGATMGHRYSNMLNMHQAPHKSVHRMYDVDTTALRKELAQINTVDELYERMHNHIIDRILPAKNMALDEQISYLKSNPKFGPRLLEEAQALRDAFKSQISPKQLSAIDEYIEALKLRGS